MSFSSEKLKNSSVLPKDPPRKARKFAREFFDFKAYKPPLQPSSGKPSSFIAKIEGCSDDFLHEDTLPKLDLWTLPRPFANIAVSLSPSFQLRGADLSAAHPEFKLSPLSCRKKGPRDYFRFPQRKGRISREILSDLEVSCFPFLSERGLHQTLLAKTLLTYELSFVSGPRQ